MNEEVKSIYMICNTIIVLLNFLLYAVLKVHIFTVSCKKNCCHLTKKIYIFNIVTFLCEKFLILWGTLQNFMYNCFNSLEQVTLKAKHSSCNAECDMCKPKINFLYKLLKCSWISSLQTCFTLFSLRQWCISLPQSLKFDKWVWQNS